ncbi:hypothetical protein M432DRAFT_30671 [Thermoascus aurantiacus ATCC 26904]
MDREALQRQRTNDRSRWPGTRASGRREPLSSARSLARATTFPWTPRSVDGQWAVWPFRLCAERRPPANPKSLPWRRGPGAAVPVLLSWLLRQLSSPALLSSPAFPPRPPRAHRLPVFWSPCRAKTPVLCLLVPDTPSGRPRRRASSRAEPV